MFKKAFKKLQAVYNWLFKEEEKEILQTVPNNVIEFKRRVSAPIVHNEVIYKQSSFVSAHSVPASSPIEKTSNDINLKQQYKEWTQNMREYDKLRQRLAQ
jgi:hypothetical protein